MFEQTFNDIDDIFLKDAGCSGELDQEKLPSLLQLKYQSITEAVDELGGVEKIQDTFIAFQKYLYENKVA